MIFLIVDFKHICLFNLLIYLLVQWKHIKRLKIQFEIDGSGISGEGERIEKELYLITFDFYQGKILVHL